MPAPNVYGVRQFNVSPAESGMNIGMRTPLTVYGWRSCVSRHWVLRGPIVG